MITNCIHCGCSSGRADQRHCTSANGHDFKNVLVFRAGMISAPPLQFKPVKLTKHQFMAARQWTIEASCQRWLFVLRHWMKFRSAKPCKLIPHCQDCWKRFNDWNTKQNK